VYNKNVEVEHEYFANGIRVHNCPECDAMEGRVFPVAEAHGLIPRHPACRCAWLPALADYREKGQVWDRRSVRSAVRESIGAERVGGTYRAAKAKSVWSGKELV